MPEKVLCGANTLLIKRCSYADYIFFFKMVLTKKTILLIPTASFIFKLPKPFFRCHSLKHIFREKLHFPSPKITSQSQNYLTSWCFKIPPTWRMKQRVRTKQLGLSDSRKKDSNASLQWERKKNIKNRTAALKCLGRWAI